MKQPVLDRELPQSIILYSFHTAKEYDYSGGLVDIHMTEKNFNAMKFRKYLLLILCFCTSLSVSALNYQSIKDILEKLNLYSEIVLVPNKLWNHP